MSIIKDPPGIRHFVVNRPVTKAVDRAMQRFIKEQGELADKVKKSKKRKKQLH
jgi:hypothetical protein